MSEKGAKRYVPLAEPKDLLFLNSFTLNAVDMDYSRGAIYYNLNMWPKITKAAGNLKRSFLIFDLCSIDTYGLLESDNYNLDMWPKLT